MTNRFITLSSSVARLTAASVLTVAAAISGNPAFADYTRRANSDVLPIEAVDLFVPNGFDANDEIVVVIDGYLPDSCFRLTRPEVNIDRDRKTIRVTQLARKFPGPCLVPLVPFTNIIAVGALEAGDWMVTTNRGVLNQQLHVSADTSSDGQFGPDSHLYAPVDSVSVVSDSNGNFTAKVEGRFTNSCMKIVEVKVMHKGRVIELLPILDEQAMVDNQCAAVEKSFSKTVKLPAELEVGRNLVHVRSLNGNSVNTVFSVEP
jgi:hypothetical protein